MTRASLIPWLLAATLAASAGVAHAQSPADAVVRQLREQGYVDFAITRTLLGRVRVVALAPGGEQREIVFNPATGEILRDYSEAADGSAAPGILDRPQADDRPAAASSPSRGGGGYGTSPADGSDDGNRGHGNDEDGDDGGNPGRGNGTAGKPGRGGGNGSSKD